VKRWALLTVGLYAALVFLLTTPLILYLYLPRPDARELWEVFSVFYLPVFILAQLVLLLVPVDVSRQRPVPRRKIVVSAIVGGLLMCLLAVLFVFSVVVMIWEEELVLNKYRLPWAWLLLIAASWLGWGAWFYRRYRADDPGHHVSTISRWLLTGSILEMIVAIPSHIISRNRNECCAPPATFLGIMTGLSVALLSFGPGVFFLFARRIRQKRIGREG